MDLQCLFYGYGACLLFLRRQRTFNANSKQNAARRSCHVIGTFLFNEAEELSSDAETRDCGNPDPSVVLPVARLQTEKVEDTWSSQVVRMDRNLRFDLRGEEYWNFRIDFSQRVPFIIVVCERVRPSIKPTPESVLHLEKANVLVWRECRAR